MRKGRDPEPDPYLWLMDPDPGGQPDPQHFWVKLKISSNNEIVASCHLFILGADEQFLDAPGDGLRPPDHLLLGGQDLLHTSHLHFQHSKQQQIKIWPRIFLIRVWWPYATLLAFIFLFYIHKYSLRPISISSQLSAQWAEPPWGAEPRFEFGPALLLQASLELTTNLATLHPIRTKNCATKFAVSQIQDTICYEMFCDVLIGTDLTVQKFTWYSVPSW